MVDLGEVAIGSSLFGLAVGAAIKLFGFVIDLVKARMEDKHRTKEDERQDLDQAFARAEKIIKYQGEEIESLKREIAAQEERFRCLLAEQEQKFEALQQQSMLDQAKIASLEERIRTYEKIMRGGPKWAREKLEGQE